MKKINLHNLSAAFLFLLLALSSLSFASINASSSSYSVEMFTLGILAGTPNSSLFSSRVLMTPFQPSTRNAFGSTYSANIGFFSVSSAPSIASKGISPRALINGTMVNLSISASGFQSLWATITLPNSSTTALALANNANTSFSQTELVGRHNVTFYANNSAGATVSETDYFETFMPTTFNFSVVNENSSGTASSVEYYYQGELIQLVSSSTGNFSSDVINTTLDILVKSYSNQTWITLRGVNLSLEENKAILIERSNSSPGYLIVYGINNTLAISNATVRIYYNDTAVANESALHLWKCSSFDYSTFACIGSWQDLTSSAVQNTSAHYFELLVTSFSGFGVQQGAYCGDGICSGGETCSSCPTDCGACPSPTPGPGPSGGETGGGSTSSSFGVVRANESTAPPSNESTAPVQPPAPPKAPEATLVQTTGNATLGSTVLIYALAADLTPVSGTTIEVIDSNQHRFSVVTDSSGKAELYLDTPGVYTFSLPASGIQAAGSLQVSAPPEQKPAITPMAPQTPVMSPQPQTPSTPEGSITQILSTYLETFKKASWALTIGFIAVVALLLLLFILRNRPRSPETRPSKPEKDPDEPEQGTGIAATPETKKAAAPKHEGGLFEHHKKGKRLAKRVRAPRKIEKEIFIGSLKTERGRTLLPKEHIEELKAKLPPREPDEAVAHSPDNNGRL